MKLTSSDMDTATSHAPREVPASFAPAPSGHRFVSLRMKFVAFFSLILVLTISALSWYFVETRRQAMTENLHRTGTILLTNTVHNDHFRFGGLVGEDPIILRQFVEGLMAIDNVVYVVVTSSDGRVLDQRSKLTRILSDNTQQAQEQPLYPDHQLAIALLGSEASTLETTQLSLSSEQTLIPTEISSEWLLPFLVWHETIYDFAMPLIRKQDANAPLPHFSVEREEGPPPLSSLQTTPVYGVVQIGITDAEAKRELLLIIRNVLILTVLLIGAGIFGAHVLTSRITTPLRSLAGAARQLAEGTESPVPLATRTRDEVGQLTSLFNEMTRSLHERNQAITANLETIKRQVSQLTTLHQSSATIASTLNMNQLLDSVLKLLVDNLGFSRMVLILRHAGGDVAYVAQITGVSPVIAEAARNLQIPIKDDGSITADLLIHGNPLLIPDVETVTERLHPPVLDLLRRSGVRSFVCVPLQSHNRILGYLAGDRDIQPCTH